MSEEEKKAIKYLEFLSNEKCECDACQNAKKQYKIILNLIEEQQNEIEDWKFTSKYIEDNYISKDKIRVKIKELENQPKHGYSTHSDFLYESDEVLEIIIENLKELLEE